MHLVSPYLQTPENAKLIQETYVYLCDYEGIVTIWDMFEQMYNEISSNWLEEQIDAAIYRREHEWYNLEPKNFRTHVYAGYIELGDFEAETGELFRLVEDYLSTNLYFYEKVDDFVNEPLQEVW